MSPCDQNETKLNKPRATAGPGQVAACIYLRRQRPKARLAGKRLFGVAFFRDPHWPREEVLEIGGVQAPTGWQAPILCGGQRIGLE